MGEAGRTGQHNQPRHYYYATRQGSGPRGESYSRMIELCPAGRAGTPDEVGTLGALLMGPDGAFITGSDFLMDGGVTAAYWYCELVLADPEHPRMTQCGGGPSRVIAPRPRAPG